MGQFGDSNGYVIPTKCWAWASTPRGLSISLWIVAISVGLFFLWHAFVWFHDPRSLPTERQRVDGNSGHCQIDFGGQWVMGRMLVRGHGKELYHRQRQWEVVRAGYPVSDEPLLVREESILPSASRSRAKPDETIRHDCESLMNWFMGADPEEWKIVAGASVTPLATDLFGNPLLTAALTQCADQAITPEVQTAVTKPAIGGPLYPPVHAVFYAPLGLIDRPQVAYRVIQVFGVLMVFLAGLGVSILTEGRVRWSVATIVLFLFPGTRGGLDLGQNPTLSLAIVVWGWALASRGYAVAGGAVWGLFAFKPVWGLAFFLVPVLTRRWRFCAAMVGTGLALVAATIPFVGVQSWFDWLAVGREAAALYNVNNNWIHLSRDVQGIPRRILHDFTKPEAERETWLSIGLAWALWTLILGTTAIVYSWFADRKRFTGIGAAFLFLGAHLTCYRFMYYDVLLAAMGCALLFADPARFVRTRVFSLTLVPQANPLAVDRALPSPANPITTHGVLGPRLLGYVCSFPLTILAMLLVYENMVSGMELQATLGYGYLGRIQTSSDGTTSFVLPKVQFDTGVRYPWETALIFLLWLWCGWSLLRGEERT